ncbi:MAG: hypothetical protein V3R25_04190 [Nitrosomonadaceae bacterium]
MKPYIARVTIRGNISRRPTGSPGFDALGNRPRYFSSAAATMLGRARLRPEISASSIRFVPYIDTHKKGNSTGWRTNDANLLLGTDTIVGMRYENPPSLDGYGEMKGRFKVNVSVKQILAAAIINNARPCKLANAYDDIETVILVGKSASRDL